MSISKFAYIQTGSEREFAAWLFKKKMGLQVKGEEIKCKKGPVTIIFYLVRSKGPNGSIPIELSVREYKEAQREYEMSSNQLMYDELVIMFLEAEARRIYAKWAYKRLEQQGERNVRWDDLSDEKREGFLEEAKEKFVI
ncbi:MAG: hypothetical protein WCC10_10895 [Tumebacillaceae bacterium]